jgi:hypothetical protein
MTARSRDDTPPAILRGKIDRSGRVGRSVECRSPDLARVGWNFERATRRSARGTLPPRRVSPCTFAGASVRDSFGDRVEDEARAE